MITEALLATAPNPVPLSVGGHTFRMVPVRGGTFMMGSKKDDPDSYDDERPVHPVQLSDYWIGQFPVTQALWRAVGLTPGPSPEERGVSLDPDPSFFKGDRRPVERVSWDDAQVFIQKLNLLMPGWNFRLPTEAEWEYAARSPAEGTKARGGPSEEVTQSHPLTTRYAGSDRLETVAWWDGNSNGETKPVGLKLPNALGLFDMSGNVWEWCADWFDEKYYQKCLEKGTELDPRNDEAGSLRVLRGGSWIDDDPRYCRVAGRGSNVPTYRLIIIGFRLVASPSSSVASL